MRLSEPRMQPVQDDEATDEQREILAAAATRRFESRSAAQLHAKTQ